MPKRDDRLLIQDMMDACIDIHLFLKGCSQSEFESNRMIHYAVIKAFEIITWATILLSKGVAPAKVMVMGGWKDLKTMMIYMRKAEIDIKGITDKLDLHNPRFETARILDFSKK